MLARCSRWGDEAFALHAVPRSTKVELFSCVAAVASMEQVYPFC